MKNLLFLIVSLFIVFSCNNDDDENNELNIIGKWNLIKAEEYVEGELVYTVSFNEECYNTIQFNTNGTYFSQSVDEDSCEVDYEESGEYTYNNFIISVTDEDGEVYNTEVINLTEDALVLKSEEEYDEEEDQNYYDKLYLERAN